MTNYFGGVIHCLDLATKNKPCQRDAAGFPHEISEKLLQEKAMAETHAGNKVTININTNQYHLVVFLILLTQFPDKNMTIRPENRPMGKKV